MVFWIAGGVVALAAGVWAFWPRAGAGVDRRAFNARQHNRGVSEGIVNSNARDFPPL